ncbi:MAG TPA: hypothetical protein VFB56_08375, partial [Nitrospiraceae bacterium]|nr:hypothetical protein [Nitrospiraceae bacterium]
SETQPDIVIVPAMMSATNHRGFMRTSHYLIRFEMAAVTKWQGFRTRLAGLLRNASCVCQAKTNVNTIRSQ